ncbi:MAG: helix-turn-helix domain-containing protein [bacterium]
MPDNSDGNGFISKEITSEKTLGEFLAEARENMGLDLDEMADKVKIQEKYLYYLEIGDYEQLPADVYVKGFIRHYAKMLDLSSEKMLNLYRQEKGIYDNMNKEQEPPKPMIENRVTITPKMFRYGIIIVGILIVIAYFWYQIAAFTSNPDLVITNPEDNTLIKDSIVMVEGSTKKGAEVTINDQSVFVNEEGIFSEMVTLQEGINTLTITSTDKRNNSTTEQIQVRSEPPEEETVTPNVEIETAESDTANKPVVVVVSIKDEATWISVTIDDDENFSSTMLPGSEKTFTGVSKIVVASGKPDKTFVIVNGEDKGALGGSAEVGQDIEFTN